MHFVGFVVGGGVDQIIKSFEHATPLIMIGRCVASKIRNIKSPSSSVNTIPKTKFTAVIEKHLSIAKQEDTKQRSTMARGTYLYPPLFQLLTTQDVIKLVANLFFKLAKPGLFLFIFVLFSKQ